MPVIQLPKDTRFGELGAGLGNVLGGVLSAYQDKQTSAGVAQIMQDDTIASSEKPSRILKDFGDKGYEYYKKLIQTQVFESQMKENLARAGLIGIQQKVAEQTLPLAQRGELAKIAHTEQQTKASETLTPVQAALTGAQVGQTQQATARSAATLPLDLAEKSAETDYKRSQAGHLGAQTATLEETLAAQRTAREQFNAGGGGEARLDAALSQFKDLTDADRGIAKEVFKANELQKPGTGYDKMIDYSVKRQSEASKRSEIKPAPVDERKTASADAAHATSALRFMDEFANKGGAERVGMFKGAPAIAFAEKWGVATGDPQIVSMINSAKQQVQSTATSGGGFFAQGRVKLAQDVTPAVTGSPLHELIVMDEVADRKLAELKTNLSGFEGTATNTKPLESAISQWEKVKAITGTLQSDTVPDPRYPNDPRSGRTVMFFMGNQIDPKSFKPLVKNDSSLYTIGGGRKIPGTMLFEMSKPPTGPDDSIHKNKDPAQILRELGGRV